jgi:flagellar hook-basal body complex protein FliE
MEGMMQVSGIDSSAIDAMVAQLKAAATRTQPGVGPLSSASQTETSATPIDFSQVLKSSLDSVASMQNSAEKLQQKFTMGDDSVNLSDVMISMQKASLSFQATMQVRNKLVTAYTDVMNMQV